MEDGRLFLCTNMFFLQLYKHICTFLSPERHTEDVKDTTDTFLADFLLMKPLVNETLGIAIRPFCVGITGVC